jgi:uncharacterized RDD family membrane protein YckC
VPPESGLTPGDPLGGDRRPSPVPPAEGRPAGAPDRAAADRPASGYTSPAPPGAGGPVWSGSPGPVAGRWVLSGWWRRVFAALIDGVLIAAITVALLIVLIVPLVDGLSHVAAWIVGAFIVVLVVAALWLLYAPVMMARTNGQTVGRMAMDIRVVRANGQPITFWFAVLREVVVKVLLFSILPAVLHLLDALWPLWDEENRAIHDWIVNTRVVRD